MSTVFEAEPWTDNRAPILASETEYKQNFFNTSGSPDNSMEYRNGNQHRGEHHFVSESERNSLNMLVPRNVRVPMDPIRLTRDQELVLCRIISNDLPRFNPKELEDVYLECSQMDKELRGFCEFDTVERSLERHRVSYVFTTVFIIWFTKIMDLLVLLPNALYGTLLVSST